MTSEIVYGKEGDGGCYKELAAPKDYQGKVERRLSVIPLLYYPSHTSIPQPKPVVFCYTKSKEGKFLSCIKWYKGNPGNYFAQHLVFEENDTLIDAGPAWLAKRRGFYIETISEWSERDIEKTKMYSWKPNIQPSDYCIGLEEKLPEHIDKRIQAIADAWNSENVQEKKRQFVLLFDPKEYDDRGRLDLLYELYARLRRDRRWEYQFCTFDGQRGEKPPLKWDIVFVAEDDIKTRDYYTNQKYEPIYLKSK